jgi:hypothetical protein
VHVSRSFRSGVETFFSFRYTDFIFWEAGSIGMDGILAFRDGWVVALSFSLHVTARLVWSWGKEVYLMHFVWGWFIGSVRSFMFGFPCLILRTIHH